MGEISERQNEVLDQETIDTYGVANTADYNEVLRIIGNRERTNLETDALANKRTVVQSLLEGKRNLISMGGNTGDLNIEVELLSAINQSYLSKDLLKDEPIDTSHAEELQTKLNVQTINTYGVINQNDLEYVEGVMKDEALNEIFLKSAGEQGVTAVIALIDHFNHLKKISIKFEREPEQYTIETLENLNELRSKFDQYKSSNS